jgi:esterase/lipase
MKNDKDTIFIFVHGSGANDRDETVREGNVVLKPFKDLAENLANNGYSSYRYDKRSYIYMNQGIKKDIDPIDFINDAKNAYKFIEREYNYQNIYLVGHSQGATFVPLIVDNNFDKAIALSPGTEEFIDQMIYQMDYQIKYFNNLDNPEQYKDTISQLKNIKKQANEIKNNIETGEYNPEDPVLGANYDFLVKMSEITKKTINNFKNIEIPTLIINGTVDLKTPHEKLEEYEEELLKNKNIDIKYIKGMGHMLNIVGSLEQSQELTEIIVNWIEGD